MNVKPIVITSARNLNAFNALGSYVFAVSLNSCSGIPSDQSSNTVDNFRLDIIVHNTDSTVMTQILTIPQGSVFARYERTITKPQGALNWGGSNLGYQAWHRVHFVGDTYASNFIPDTTNSRNLGSSSVTWANIYTQNAVTVVSDRNAKNSIQEIDDRVLDAWAEVEQKQYKLNGDDNWSFGYIAQDIVDAFTKHGLDYKDYNIVHEENGKFMLKYDMCAVLESALNRRYNTGVDR